MKLLFEAAPRICGQHFKYAKVQPHAQARDYLEALEVLTQIGILHRVFANTASGIPLAVQKNEKKFKLLFLDIGLLPHSAESILDAEDLTLINQGSLAEQFVGQEFITYAKPYSRSTLYYWEREKSGANAEVDYVIEMGPHVIPIEVKAGFQGKLRSLKQFLSEKKAPLGIQLSQASLSLEGNILSVPFYMVGELSRLISAAL